MSTLAPSPTAPAAPAQERRGLDPATAAERLQRDGPNALELENRHGLWQIVLEVIGDPMFLLLFAAGGAYAALGDLGEAALLLGFVVLIAAVTVAQSQRTSRALEALRSYSQPLARVWRGAVLQRIPTQDVVAGDELLLEEGDRVPADGLLLESHELSVDESTLTGESAAVRKRVAMEGDAADKPGGEDMPFAWAGTLVVQGQGVLRVSATGPRTAFGALGHAVRQAEPPPSPLQREMAQLVRRFAWLAAGLSLATAGLYALLHGNWAPALLAGIALAMSLLPQEFPVILTAFQALGAWRLARQGVLVRRAAAIERLGEATVLCVDKTGTLTENKMRVQALVSLDGRGWRAADDGPLDEAGRTLLLYAFLASERRPLDAMELAIHELASAHIAPMAAATTAWRIEHEYALARDFLAMTHVWHEPGADGWHLAAKGAPEAIADLCHLSAPAVQAVLQHTGRLAAEGLRVLGVARGRYDGAGWPSIQHDMDYEFLGLIALADPLRPEVPAAVQTCHDAGVRVVMMTGDYPSTAEAIARQAGLQGSRSATGAEVAGMDDAQLARLVPEVDVYARLMPEQKLRVVQALHARGEVVAMTGDGVNDAPALAAAHIGVAMAQRGSQPAREAAALLLLRDSFADLVDALAMGRRIYDNLVRSMRYIVAVHLPIAGLSLLPLVLGLAGWRLSTILRPAHVAFLELIIAPVCSLIFEAEPPAPDTMRRPARRASDSLMSTRLLISAMLQGSAALLGAAAVWGLALHQGLNADAARALCFASVVLSDLTLVLSNQTRGVPWTWVRLRRWLAMAIVTLCALGAVLWVPVLRHLFGFDPVPPAWLAAPALAAALTAVIGRLTLLATR